MYESENEKMEHQYTHSLEAYLHGLFNVTNNLNKKNTDVLDYLSNGDNFKNIPNELLGSGKSVIASHPDIANNQLFVIEPNGQAFLIRVEGKENIKERELTPDEYVIIRGTINGVFKYEGNPELEEYVQKQAQKMQNGEISELDFLRELVSLQQKEIRILEHNVTMWQGRYYKKFCEKID